MEITIRTTHPPRCLSPNAKRPWIPLARKKFDLMRSAERDRVKSDARLLALAELGERRDFHPTSYTVTWYYAGTKPDADNVLGYCKHILDGCAAAFGIDDRTLECAGIRRVHTLDHPTRRELEITFTNTEGGGK